MSLPQDPVMLLSVVNVALRDRFPSLERFCKANSISEDELKERLAAINYEYDEELNQFK